jgi:hypothetical protein
MGTFAASVKAISQLSRARKIIYPKLSFRLSPVRLDVGECAEQKE